MALFGLLFFVSDKNIFLNDKKMAETMAFSIL